MRFERLSEWLAWQEDLHPVAIDMGLERIREVMRKLDMTAPVCPVITIAGTKGKGSCAAITHSILGAAGYRVGLFTSPHLRRYNERIRIAGSEVSDDALCVAFERIDQARGEISLTYFEFNALAAFLCFESAALDAWVLEVGMGGRLDAVNVIDADVAIVTSIGLDHTEWLGSDLESIAREKAGIFRRDRPALFGSIDMPCAIQVAAVDAGAPLLRIGRDFDFRHHENGWTWIMGRRQLAGLPPVGLAGEVQFNNASCALAALQLLHERLPVPRAAIEQGLRSVHLDGRLQRILSPHGGVEWLLDVAHNTLSAQVLAQHLATLPKRRTLAVFGVMADKDLDGIVAAMAAHVDVWLPAALPGNRALPVAQLAERLRAAGVAVLPPATALQTAFMQAGEQGKSGSIERILVFGSFLAVGPALDRLAL